MDAKIRMNDGKIITRKVKHERLGNFVFNIVRINNLFYLLGEGDEYMRGYDDVYDFKDLRRTRK